jgi:hypothetical protein
LPQTALALCLQALRRPVQALEMLQGRAPLICEMTLP